MPYEAVMVSRTSWTTRRTQTVDLALAYLGAQHAHRVRLKHVIDEHIDRVLEATDDNLSAAAKLLGVNRRSLQRRMQRKKQRRGR
jgi:ActR/RegA family two-component response regulator